MKRPATAGALLLAVLLAFPSLGSAQAMRTITGHVTAQGASEPPAGVQVVVKGTNIGTLTDAKGNFTIQAPGNATTLVLTYIGYKTANVPIQGHVEVTMTQEAIGLQGLVVTALGIEREKKTLGYSIQDVSGSEVNNVPQTNVINTLQGRVAGVHITNAGITGGSSRIVIRGSSSLTGNNQPLFIVDGVPVDNSDYGSTSASGYAGTDWGNSLNNLDPNNIQSISVLKGPNAAALYGSRASNGAVVITTKSARPGSNYGITATSSLTFQSPLKLPEYQNVYGQGWFGQFNWVNGAGAGLWDGTDESWGPPLNAGLKINQFTGQNMPWIAHPGNVRDYWKEGSQWITNVAVGRATTNNNIRLSVTHGDILSMAPGYSILRNDVALKGGSSITSRLKAQASLMYSEEKDHNRMGIGYSDANPMQNFTWFGRQVDIVALHPYVCSAASPTPCALGGEFNWNYNFHDNPYWVQFMNGSSQNRDRLTGFAGLTYQINDWLTVQGKVARDWYRWYQHRQTNKTTVGSGFGYQGGFSDNNIYQNETNYYLTLNGTRQLTPSILMNFDLGAQTRKDNYQNDYQQVSGLVVFGIYNTSNAAQAPTSSNYISNKEVRSVYGDLSMNYKGWWNVDLTGRNDWSSTLPAGNQSYFYPSVSSAFEFTQALGMNSSILSSGKIRASWAQVGSDTSPYQLLATLGADQPWGGSTPLFYVGNGLPNETLKPERTKSWEAGTDLGFFNERMGFVFTYYHNTTYDEIMPVDVSSSSGYTSEILNAGQVLNKGVELQLTATPLKLDNGFRWDMTLNWAKNSNEVQKLYGDVQALNLGGQWSLHIEARKGQSYGDMYAVNTLRCDAAQINAGNCTSAQKGLVMLSSSGLPIHNPVQSVVGNYNPQWTGGINNRFSYGAWDLSILFDGQFGGNLFSVTDWFGHQAGVLSGSLPGRMDGPYAHNMVVKGVLPDGVTNGTSETQTTTAWSYYHNWWGNQTRAVVDASYLKLRELRLGYQLPASLMSRIGFSSGTVALVGHNLLLFAHTRNLDPETAYNSGSNVQGIESGQFPSARSYGFSISIRP